MHRRRFLTTTVAAVAASGGHLAVASPDASLPIVDTHQHLWDLDRSSLPWLSTVPAFLNRSFYLSDYLAATRGLNVIKAIYLEVDVEPSQQTDEARFVTSICRDPKHPTVGGVISGRPESRAFKKYIDQFKDNTHIKGLRRLMESTPAGFCLQPQFVRSVQYLGKLGKHFEITIQPTQLSDALGLVTRCPEVRFVIDHCGTADPKAFLSERARGGQKPLHDADRWKTDMSRLADQSNTVCKISGIVANAPEGWETDQLAPVVDHCLDAFGPDRVMFGGDWPACLLGARLDQWVNALREIVAARPAGQQRRLFHDNAIGFYRLT